MNKRHTFTLVEILFVIGIIIILSTLILSAVIYAPKKARMAAAKSDITALYNAIRQFEADYGAFPVPESKTGVFTFEQDSDDYEWLIKVLQGETLSGSDDINSRHRKYLDIQGNTKGIFQDPWGKDYIITLNLDYNGEITDDIPDGIDETKAGIKENKIYRDIVIWSSGPDKKSYALNDPSVYPPNEEEEKRRRENKDNIYSFNTSWDSKKSVHHITR